MSQSVKKNYIYNLIYHILILILPLITAPYISRILGAENIGIYSYVISISAYFITFGTLGMTIYGQREIAYRQKDKKEYSKIFWEILILKLVTMTISATLFYFIFARGTTYTIYYKILMLELIGNCLDIGWFFQGLEEFKKTIKKNVIVKILSVIAIFCLVKTKDDLYKYLIIYALSILLGNMSLWTYLPKYIEKVKIKELKILRHIKPTINFFIPQIAMQIYTLLDKTMLGNIILDKSEVGFYEQSQKIVRMVLTLITSLGTVMLPRIASKFSEGKKDEIENYMKKSFNFVFLLAYPMIFGIIAVSPNFVPVFFGKGYDRVSLIMNVISPIILLIGLNTIIGSQYLLPTKRQTEYTKSIVSGSIINVIMNFLLIKPYGAIGASIATVIAELTVLLMEMYFTRKEFNYKKIFLLSIKYIISSVIMFIVCILIGRIINNDFICTITQVAVGMIIYFISLLIMKEEFVIYAISKIKGIKDKLKDK